MAIIRIKHVKRVRVKGRTYWYHRKTGERLPDDPEERALRAAEINRCLNGQRRTIAAGSVQAVITLYKAAPNFRSLAATTKKDYALYLDIINEKWGRLPIADIRKPHILAFRDQFADKPGKANGLLKSELQRLKKLGIPKTVYEGRPDIFERNKSLEDVQRLLTNLNWRLNR